MPRPKKAAGTAVDPRNGIKAIDMVGLPKAVPRFDPPFGINRHAREVWEEFWKDRQAMLLTPSSKVVLVRWIEAVSRYDRMIKQADREPLIQGQQTTVVNPLYRIAKDAYATIVECEKQLGIGTLNSTSLGMAALAEKTRLADLNERYDGEEADDDDVRSAAHSAVRAEIEPEQDPRLLNDDQLMP